jgi:glycosyltransferase involved in cell wall biosynthesis
MRICLVYDRLHPWTLGGAERWVRDVGDVLVEHGHEVTFLTLRHWGRDVRPSIPGARVVAMGPKLPDYNETRRTVLPPIIFGVCVLWHLLRHGRSYDVVHTASFPYFSLLAAGVVRPFAGYRLVVDWHEVWTRAYWVSYLGRVGGLIGWLVQWLCIRIPQRAYTPSRMQASRLRAEGLRGPIDVLDGRYSGPSAPVLDGGIRRAPTVVFAGRHIPEKRVPALLPAFARVVREVPELRLEIYGDGPDTSRVRGLVSELGLDGYVRVHGFVAEHAVVDDAIARAECMVLPSRREGYGLVVVEAIARGTPAVVVLDPDNAATELVEDGVNGVVAASASPEDLAEAILRVHRMGPELRERTAEWFARNASRLSLATSLERVAAAYDAADS